MPTLTPAVNPGSQGRAGGLTRSGHATAALRLAEVGFGHGT
jgi:hypothetical protein